MSTSTSLITMTPAELRLLANMMDDIRRVAGVDVAVLSVTDGMRITVQRAGDDMVAMVGGAQ